MNDNTQNDTINQPISIKNEATPYASVLTHTTLSPTAGYSSGTSAGDAS